MSASMQSISAVENGPSKVWKCIPQSLQASSKSGLLTIRTRICEYVYVCPCLAYPSFIRAELGVVVPCR